MTQKDGLVNSCKSEISCLKWKFSILKSGLILKFPILVYSNSTYQQQFVWVVLAKFPEMLVSRYHHASRIYQPQKPVVEPLPHPSPSLPWWAGLQEDEPCGISVSRYQRLLWVCKWLENELVMCLATSPIEHDNIYTFKFTMTNLGTASIVHP